MIIPIFAETLSFMKYSQIHRFYLIDGFLYLNTEGMSTKVMLERINESLISDGFPPITLRQLQNDLNDVKEQLNAPIDNGKGKRKVKYDDMCILISCTSIITDGICSDFLKRETIRFEGRRQTQQKTE